MRTWRTLKEIRPRSQILYQKMNFCGASTNGKFCWSSLLNRKEDYFEENEHFIHCFFLFWPVQLHSRYWMSHFFKKKSRGSSTNRKLLGIRILITNETVLKKINVSFIVNFCLGKYNLCLDTFQTHLVFW